MTAYIQALQSIRNQTRREDALHARLAQISIGGHQTGSLSENDPLPRGYLGKALTASLCLYVHLQWNR